MTLFRLYRYVGGQQSTSEEAALLRRARHVCPHISSFVTEICFYIQIDHRDGMSRASKTLREALGGNKGLEALSWVLGDSWAEGEARGLTEVSRLQVLDPDKQVIIEIGPRLTFMTAWSTNAVSICTAAGLTGIGRLERALRYLVSLDATAGLHLTQEMKKKVVSALHDEMTQQVYPEPLTTFTPYEHAPMPWTSVDVLEKGRVALEEVNASMGLAFDDWDLDYYTELFRTKAERNPTTVELFDLAQSNSEHSRHWFFKGRYVADGKELPHSLFELIMSTNMPATTNSNNVIKFSDNSSGIQGYNTKVVTASNPNKSSEFVVEEKLRHIVFTAETHNFPTGVAPFSGATTGTGGRIRDVQAVGRGGHVIAGTAGYCFGNLHIPGYHMPWEDPNAIYPPNFALPLEVAIQASNGASDYGNKFGEPVLAGFARSFGAELGGGDGGKVERREWIKPIMFSGGVGTLDHDFVHKHTPAKGDLIVKVGGPVYRIGVGGGAASSVQVQGDNTVERDLGAVQRGDAEMEQKMNRILRGCIERSDHNPIRAIHDQGAGGNANVLKELCEGSGGVIFTKSFKLGDHTLSTLEIWGAEYQESNAMLVAPGDLPALKDLSRRERCSVEAVGVITEDDKVRLVENMMDLDLGIEELVKGKHPVDLKLDWVLGKMPQKVFHWTTDHVVPLSLVLPLDATVQDALERVLRLPAVASKRYLTNKVDRSVTGLVAQQQCVGPLHTPLADVAVTALSHFDKRGCATSIGEQPIKLLVDPSAGARITVLEALSNLVSAAISDIKDVKCSGNWMWAAKLAGEGWQLYQACQAMCSIMKQIGIGLDGGKDSLSMAARIPGIDGKAATLVKSPGDLVVSCYAPCPDVNKVVTPDLKSPGRGHAGALIWVRPVTSQARMGGSALAQVYGQVGSQCPDADQKEIETFVSAFKVIQKLISQNQVLALHDISDGGIVTCLLEMALAGWGGLEVNLPAAGPEDDERESFITTLFNEEVGWIMEVEESNAKVVVDQLKAAGVVGTSYVGRSGNAGPKAKIQVKISGQTVINMSVLEVANLWEETSYQLERLQASPNCASQEYHSLAHRKHTSYTVTFSYRPILCGPAMWLPYVPHVAVLREEGTNGDREMAAALLQAGFIVHDLTMSDLVDRDHGGPDVSAFRGIIFPGGFSYADVLGSAVGWAASIKFRSAGLGAHLEAWRMQSDTFSLGVCNGCQLLALLGWLDPDSNLNPDSSSIRLTHNKSGRFESRWSRVSVESSRSVLLRGMGGSTLGVWVAHGEGRFQYANEMTRSLVKSSGCVALRYVDDSDAPTTAYPMNPNGSEDGVAGLTSPCGRHLALMPHPERCTVTWQWPYKSNLAAPGGPSTFSDSYIPPPAEAPATAAPWARLFQNAFDWCLENRK
ncbi:phosphoribosylformylglycinamidine synthase [Oratosquilla oratoria]|uniref:phosphoribosylformylglycinamidine synthase n=1 Tax=Oratosquilla oratoria TaxID=337810 RepID=UPI003F767299